MRYIIRYISDITADSKDEAVAYFMEEIQNLEPDDLKITSPDDDTLDQ